MAGMRLPCGGFEDQSFAIQKWKYTDKRHKWKGKVQKNIQFLFWTKERFLLQGIRPCFLHGRALGLFWTNQGTHVFCTL